MILLQLWLWRRSGRSLLLTVVAAVMVADVGVVASDSTHFSASVAERCPQFPTLHFRLSHFQGALSHLFSVYVCQCWSPWRCSGTC